MKKTLLALATFGTFVGIAHAQSSVTLYGTIDTGINYVSQTWTADTIGGSTGRAYALSSGVIQASHWGIRGAEDIDHGLKAIFTVESGFDVNTGKSDQANTLFDRQAFVGLAGNFGSVTIGRQYDSLNDFVTPLTAGSRGAGQFGAHPADIDNLDNSVRLNNAIKYTSADYDGITFGGVYSMGGTPGNFSNNQVWSAGASFINGPLAIGAAFLQAKNPNTSFFGNSSHDATENHLPSMVTAGYASARSLQIAAAGATYAFGPLTAGALFSNVQFKGLGDVNSGPITEGVTGKGTLNTTEASLAYQFSPVLSGIVSGSFTKSNSVAGKKGARYKQLNVGLDYALSKRTGVYFLAAGQKASGTNSFNIEAEAEINGFSPSNSGKQLVARVGMRHAF